jgi:hypothetical protein
MKRMSPALLISLLHVAEWLDSYPAPHAVIGSAALAVHLSRLGHDGLVEAGDLDLVLLADDANRLLAQIGAEPAVKAPHARFSSTVFARIEVQNGVPVEIMGGFAVARPDGWQQVWPIATTKITGINGFGAKGLQVATPQALAHQFALFDRPKDQARLALLRRYFLSV